MTARGRQTKIPRKTNPKGVERMILKSITMQGFKSFADKTTIELDGNVCAIVGPNGSGKSNISDAILWVLGEQSAKTLRGSKMEDVIFTGTPKRNPSGFAEVTLILDNRTRLLPVEYAEVTFTRRVYRSGEGEYFINKTPCRLKDIHEMLMDTGMGRDGYSIIGQGKIDGILYANPEDRRSMFEEASGISKYKYRKAEATRKLEKTMDNLVRIGDIVLELEAQIGPLAEQSEKAQKFLALSEELKALEVTAFVNSIEKNRAAYEKAKKNYEDAGAAFNEEKAKSEANERAIEAYYEEKKMFDSKIESIRSEASALLVEIARQESNISMKKSARENLEANTSRLKEEIDALNKENEQGSIDAAQAKLLDAKAHKEALMRELNDLVTEPLREKADLLSAQTAKQATAVDVLAVQIEGKIGRLESFDVLVDDQSKRLTALEQEEQALKGDVQKEEEALSALFDMKQKEDEERSHFDSEKARLSDRFAALNRDDETLKQRYNEENRAMQEERSRLKFLEELEREMDGYSGAVKSVLENKSLQGICGVISELISVEAKYIPAVEAALGGSMQNIVTETERHSRAAIDYLKERGKGRATFLPLNILKERSLETMSHEGFLGSVADVVSSADKIRPAVLNLLGNVALCDTFEHAIGLYKKQNGRVKIVTLSGEYVNAGGAVTGGSMSRVRGLLSRKKEIETLRASSREKALSVRKTELSIEKNADAIFTLRAEAQKLTEAMEKNQRAHAETLSKIEIIKNRLEDKKQRLSEMGDSKKELLYGLENRDKAKAELQEAIAASEAELASAKDELKAMTKRLEEAKETLEQTNQARLEKTMAINNAAKDMELYSSALAAARAGADSRNRLAEAKAKDIGRLKLEIEANEKETMALYRDIEALKKKHEEKGEELEAHKDDFARRDARTAKLREDNKALQEKVIALAQEMTKLSGKMEALEGTVEEEIGKLWEEYELTYSQAVAERDAKGNKSSSSALISRLRREIKELGTINVAAIEDYKTVSERYEFLSAQKQDMLEAKENLEKIIADMQKVMARQFAEQFEKINESFRETYVALTGGGTANIALAEPSAILESGIDIEIQPPGKKLQNIMLLSGGEKAIAGIALFFAMLSVRPTPFCVLDEIEAALDESNVKRFASFLRNYQKTQFLVITHRRGTMESADMLYGVTMQERGITRLLSLDLNDVEQ